MLNRSLMELICRAVEYLVERWACQGALEDPGRPSGRPQGPRVLRAGACRLCSSATYISHPRLPR